MAELGKDILKAKKILDAGELVGIPTETVYGLAGNALSPASVAKIFAVKNRPFFDPLIVHVSSLEQAQKYAVHFPDLALKLAATFWPGALTLLLPKNENIPDITTSGMPMVGLRCPDHELTLELLRQLDFPLAAPSANPFGYISPTEPRHVDEQLGALIPYILDGGICKVGIESTIIGFENEKPIVYRIGGIPLEKLEQITGPLKVKNESEASPVAPGQLKSHYAPKTKLLLGDISQLLQLFDPATVGTLSYQQSFPQVKPENQFILSLSGNLEEAAQRLFLALRELDKKDIQLILAEEVPDIGIGRAINDRLRRAAV
jgi:L-threonylcarbamoyladenylate synthase